MRRTLLAAVALAALACTSTRNATANSDTATSAAAAATAAPDVGAVRRAIEAAHARYADAMRHGDTSVIRTYYAADAILMPPNVPAVRGVSAILDLARQQLSWARFPAVAVSTQDVQVAGDLAVSTGVVDFTMQAKWGTAMHGKVKFLLVWKRQPDGTWKVIRDIYNYD